MIGDIQEYYNLYYKSKNERLSSEEKKRLYELSYQRAMQIRKRTPQRYGLMLIGVAYEEFLNYYNHSQKVECTTLLYLIDKLKIRIGEICSIYSLSKVEVRDYFEKNHYVILVGALEKLWH